MCSKCGEARVPYPELREKGYRFYICTECGKVIKKPYHHTPVERRVIVLGSRSKRGSK